MPMNTFITIVAAIAMALAVSQEKDARSQEADDQRLSTTSSTYNPYTSTPVVD